MRQNLNGGEDPPPPRFRGAKPARRAAINLNEPLRRCQIRRKKAGLKKRDSWIEKVGVCRAGRAGGVGRQDGQV